MIGVKVDELFLAITTKFDKKSMAGYEESVKKAETSLGSFGEKHTRVATKQTNLSKAMAQGLKSFGAQVPIVGSMISSIDAKSLKLLGTIGLLVVAFRALSGATRTYLDFERGMKGVERVVLGTAKEMELLKKSALKEADTTTFSPAETADAQKYLAQAGLDVNQVMGALPGALQLAMASNMDLARATDIATDIMSAQGLEVKDLTMINDSLVKGANQATTSVEQLGLGMAEVGGTARRVGVDVQQMTASLGVIASAGKKGGRGGTLFRNFLEEMTGKKAIKAMRKVGIDADKFINVKTGEITQYEALIKRFTLLSKAEKKIFSDSAFSNMSRGKRGFDFLVGGADKLEKDLAGIRGASGIAERASKIAFKGLSGQTALLKSQLQTASIGFMEDSGLNVIFEDIVNIFRTAVIPSIMWLGTALQPFLYPIKLMLKSMKIAFKLVFGIFKVFTKNRNAGKEVVSEFAKLDDILEHINDSLDRFFSLLDRGDTNFFKSMNEDFASTTEGIRAFFMGIIRFINPVLEMVDLLINWLVLGVPEAGDDLALYFKDWWKDVKAGFTDIFDWWKIKFEQLGKWFGDDSMWQTIKGLLPDSMLSSATNSASPVGDGVTNTTSNTNSSKALHINGITVLANNVDEEGVANQISGQLRSLIGEL